MRQVFYYGRDNLVVIDGEVEEDFFPYIYTIGGIVKSVGVKYVEKADYTPYFFENVGYRPKSGNVYRVYVLNPSLVPKIREKALREGLAVAQSVIPYGARISADLNYREWSVEQLYDMFMQKINEKRKILAFDVEVVGKNVLIGYTYGDEVMYTNNPADLFAEDFDYIVGFNSQEFDVKYLGKFAPTEYVVDTPWGLKPHIDLFTIAQSRAKTAFGVVESGISLYEVARQIGIQVDMRLKLLRHKLSQLTTEEIKKYLAEDIKVTYELARKWISVLEMLSVITSISPPAIVQLLEKASTAMLAEIMYHKELESAGKIFTDRERQWEIYGGDKVKASAVGIYQKVVELDFNAMYPTTYYIYKVDPEGVRECADGFPVKLSERGEIKVCFDGGDVYEVLRKLYLARGVSKKLKQQGYQEVDTAVKILANSAFGGFGRVKGMGIVNEIIAGFIFQFTEKIFEDLWNYSSKISKPIYGDTDSVYIQANDSVVQELNAFVKKYGDAYELKIEDVWDKFVLLPRKDRGVAEKSYIKVKGNNVIIKGGKLKPHSLSRGLRYGGWHRIISETLNGKNFMQLIEEFVKSAPIEELFVEKSSTLYDIFHNSEGERKVRLDHMSDIPILANIALDNGGAVVAEPNMLNGRTISSRTIFDALFIPVETRETKQYILLKDAPVLSTVYVDYDGKRAIVKVHAKRVGEIEVRRACMRYLREHNAVQSILSLFSQLVLSVS